MAIIPKAGSRTYYDLKDMLEDTSVKEGASVKETEKSSLYRQINELERKLHNATETGEAILKDLFMDYFNDEKLELFRYGSSVVPSVEDPSDIDVAVWHPDKKVRENFVKKLAPRMHYGGPYQPGESKFVSYTKDNINIVIFLDEKEFQRTVMVTNILKGLPPTTKCQRLKFCNYVCERDVHSDETLTDQEYSDFLDGVFPEPEEDKTNVVYF